MVGCGKKGCDICGGNGEGRLMEAIIGGLPPFGLPGLDVMAMMHMDAKGERPETEMEINLTADAAGKDAKLAYYKKTVGIFMENEKNMLKAIKDKNETIGRLAEEKDTSIGRLTADLRKMAADLDVLSTRSREQGCLLEAKSAHIVKLTKSKDAATARLATIGKIVSKKTTSKTSKADLLKIIASVRGTL